MKKGIVQKYIQQLVVSFCRFGSLSKALKDCYEMFGAEGEFGNAIRVAFEKSQKGELYEDAMSLCNSVFGEIERLSKDARMDVVHIFLCEKELEGGGEEALELILCVMEYWNKSKKVSFRKDYGQQFQAWYLYILLQLHSNTVYQSILNSRQRFQGQFGEYVDELAKNIYRQPKKLEPYISFVERIKLGDKVECMRYLFSLSYHNSQKNYFHVIWARRAFGGGGSSFMRRGHWMSVILTGVAGIFLIFSANVMREEMAWTRTHVIWGEISSVLQERGYEENVVKECEEMAKQQGAYMELEERAECHRLKVVYPLGIGCNPIEKVGYLG